MAEGSAADGKTTGKTRALFVYDFVDVSCPLDVARQWCSGDGRRLGPLASAAGQDAAALLMRIGPSWAAGRLSREVQVNLGWCRQRGEGVAVSMKWEAVHFPSLFPVLEGDLEFAPLGGPQCRMILSASYVAPLGELGRRLDKALLHRVAESTVRSFLVRLATALEADQVLPQGFT